jgi:tRNA-N(6)-(isopentenyl)adenosine-37 thiotransferase enzyme MiaB
MFQIRRIVRGNCFARNNAIPFLFCRQFTTDVLPVFIEKYGCQMNHNDAEILLGIFESYNEGRDPRKSVCFRRATELEDARVILIMTCAIRENAENKIWNRLNELQAHKRSSKKIIGILGCMAERLKHVLLEKRNLVDIVCGPDSYRELPVLIETINTSGGTAMNVSLSLEETYADITPVRLDKESRSAYVSIMRGCNNMCAFCIVPFTRGRERSRALDSILREMEGLAREGIREVTLLGQNVNSYRYRDDSLDSALVESQLSRGFTSVCKPREAANVDFACLLDKLSMTFPDIRFRFTSPHPKDFPDSLLDVMSKRRNVCKQIHLPAQSGSTAVLERMRRGYTREAYLELVSLIREYLPGVALSSDFIAGFCGETEADHLETMSLLEAVDYDMAYLYAYSLREKTLAHRRYNDDVPDQVKQHRLQELIQQFYRLAKIRTLGHVGSRQLVLVEGESKKDKAFLSGRADSNKTVVFKPLRDVSPSIGDFVSVKITGSSGLTLIGDIEGLSSIQTFDSSIN